MFIKTAASTPGDQDETDTGVLQVGTTTTPYKAPVCVPAGSDPGGQGYVLEVPEIWNPHAWNPNATVYSGISPMGNVNTTATGTPEFKISMLSSDPNNTLPAASQPTSLAFFSRWSNINNQAYVDGPAISPFNFNGANIPWIGFDIPSTGLGFFREATLLNKPDYSNPLLNTSLLSPAITAATGYGPPVGSDVVGSIVGYTYKSDFPFYTKTYTGYIKSLYQSAGYYAAASHDNQYYLGFSLAPPNQPTLTSLWLKDSSPGTDVNGGGGNAFAAGYYQISGMGDYDGVGGVSGGNQTGNFNFTYRLQYKDPIALASGTTIWDTYDEKYLPLAVPLDGDAPTANPFLGTNGVSATFSALGTPCAAIPWTSTWSNDPAGSNCYTGTADPRTNRWASEKAVFVARSNFNTPTNPNWLPPPLTESSATKLSSPWTGWVAASVNAVMSDAPDYNLGWPAACPTSSLGFHGLQPASYGTGANITAGALELNIASGDSNYSLYSGDYSTTRYTSNQYYTDADGVVRRGSAGYMSTGASPATPYGLPFATSTTYGASSPYTPAPGSTTVGAATYYNGNRPVMLHRPFRTVAELGYTFSGTPGKNIDFSTPESGYSALLDMFCINDTNDPNNLVAGKVNINTRQAPVLEAILGAAYKDELSPYFTTSTTMLSTEASSLITNASYGLINHRTSNLTTASLGPLRNISELAGKWVSGGSTTVPINGASSSNYSGFSADMTGLTSGSPPMNVVQRFHEAAIRALAANTTCRVWNLMIDVIAQTGRFPTSATGLANFNVEGERRYWVHVAIDRYTGKVLDEQVEEVKE